MSLILDALKKLERDKESGEPGVLVVGAVPWEGVRRRRTPIVALALAVLLVLVVVAFGAWWLSRTSRLARSEASEPGRTAASTAAAAATTVDTDAASAALGVPRAPLATSATPSAPPARRLTLPDHATGAAHGASEPHEAAPAPRTGPQLNAISQQDGRPVAVIDGRLVREGDSVDGVRVLRIGATEVEVEVHGQRRTLRF